jgi:hypothetical protein
MVTAVQLRAGVSGVPERRAQRVRARKLLAIDRDLSDRERAILTDVHRFKYLTTTQLLALHFTDHSTPSAAQRICRRVLLRLSELRVIEHIDRRIGGVRAGSASFVWRVGLIGDRLLRQASGEGIRGRRKEPSLHHLDHCLAIADVYVGLTVASRQQAIEFTACDTEPDSWRRYLGAGGQPEILKPDLYLVTATGDYEDFFFTEIDRGTESLPTLVRKCQQYEQYRRTGHEQHGSGVFPRVLWVLPDDVRLAKLQAALNQARRLDHDLFRLTTPDKVVSAVTGGAA